jgi:cellulose synthase/poly-beta-1,6-N-acetylglucosamine synthase-like glycosyltransferase
MINIITITTTLICIFLVVYHHLGYPLILRWFNKRHPRLVTVASPRYYTNSPTDNVMPKITIVIPAYNEQQWIAEKIRNLAVLDYPTERLQIVIACDGCNDQTYALAVKTAAEPECCHLPIRIINFTKNRGKVAVLNQLIAELECDLVALSDTSALLSIDTLLLAAHRFKDPDVGVLTGHYGLLSPGSVGEQAYWNYQSEIKSSEAAFGSTLGAHGAFYLFRHHLFEPLPADTINDDFILPMNIVAKGYRAEYENAINALEMEKTTNDQDFKRRRRIAAGNFQQILRLKTLFSPRYRGIAFSFISGKGLRVIMPFLMILSLLGSLFLAFTYQVFFVLAALQLCAYLLASWHLFSKPNKGNKVCKLLAYLVSGHFASLIGTLRYVFRLDKGHWKKINS